MTSTFTSSPTPRTKPVVVLLCNSLGDEVDVVVVVFVGTTVRVMSCFNPCSESHATPPSMYGRATGALNLYFSTSGNSHAFESVRELMMTSTALPMLL